jgi:hypothetical protein
LGAEHTSTLDTVNNLSNLYNNQGKMAEAEAMYLRRYKEYENAVGVDYPSTRLIARQSKCTRTGQIGIFGWVAASPSLLSRV